MYRQTANQKREIMSKIVQFSTSYLIFAEMIASGMKGKIFAATETRLGAESLYSARLVLPTMQEI